MTNRLHRTGSIESLKNDYVIAVTTSKKVNRAGSAPKIKQFIRICLNHHPVNMGELKQGNVHQDDIDIEKLVANLEDGANVNAVFADLDSLQKVVEELVETDLGLSIFISGLLDEVQQCCRRTGIERHSVEQSLGIWGAKDLLPDRQTLEFHTMCGHGMVSFNFIRKMIDYIKLRRLTPKKASRILAKCCVCGAFNPARAEILFEKVMKHG
jgi:hypothetical protein